MSGESLVEVNARVEIAGGGVSGEGTIVGISSNGARIRTSQAPRPNSSVHLAFRFFETSTPFRIPARAIDASGQEFAADFSQARVVARNMLRMMLAKLRTSPAEARSSLALLRAPR